MLATFINKEKKLFSRLGFKNDQNGILKRYLRETDAWAPHLKKTKDAILDQAMTKSKNKVAILGSGWLLDVPLPELSSLFREVWLFDVRHPWKIKQQILKFGNVKTVETDISGLAQSVFNLTKHKSLSVISMENLSPVFHFDLSDFDFVVSCNLLNQLDIILLDYLLSHRKLSLEKENELRCLIQKTHLNMLPPGKSCIITDIEELWLNNRDEISGQKQLIYANLPAEGVFDQWIWHFDNYNNYHDHCKTWLKVVAIRV